MKKNKCSGFTLMELTVYMGILGIIVIVAGRAFSDSAKFRVRTGNMLEASREAENIATLFKDDVSQMGAKSSMENHVNNGDNDEFSEVYQDVYMDPNNADATKKDFSSFKFVPENPDTDPDKSLEQFVMRRIRYDADGKYQAVEEITWFLEDNVLKRSCIVVKGDANEMCAPIGTTKDGMADYTISITDGVKLFRVLPAIPSVSEENSDDVLASEVLVFPKSSGGIRLSSRVGVANLMPLLIGDPGSSVSLTGFASNFDENSDEVPSIKNYNEVYVSQNSDVNGDWKTLCASEVNHFSLDPKQEYELSFGVAIPDGDLEKAKTFVPEKDHMAVGFRNADGDKFEDVPDHIFYPPSTSEVNGVRRTIRFSVTHAVNDACLAFTFSMFSPTAANGTIEISDLKLIKVASSMYTFDPSVTSVKTIDKKNVKAFQLRLKIKRGGQDIEKGESGEATLVIPVPSNGLTD
ncbi:type II secretion system protein J [uncultured Fibrobacter sp.]|uniref:PulJ/GspJ family protein n=1 Tax=uncultured Fibrobacter sp. TaxID=261512 RepID=UPI00262DBCD4|nr:prepilin-type N-terminal cleavage/methylation domain-containing protein [uncultured Fibrobacter sp.]